MTRTPSDAARDGCGAEGGLAACPFCGEAKLLTVEQGRQSAVYCGRCGTLGPVSWGHEDNVPTAIAAWNRRALSSRLETGEEWQPIETAPQNATWIVGRYRQPFGNFYYLAVHWADGGGEEQPRFRGWFAWNGGSSGFHEVKAPDEWCSLSSRLETAREEMKETCAAEADDLGDRFELGSHQFISSDPEKYDLMQERSGGCHQAAQAIRSLSVK